MAKTKKRVLSLVLSLAMLLTLLPATALAKGEEAEGAIRIYMDAGTKSDLDGLQEWWELGGVFLVSDKYPEINRYCEYLPFADYWYTTNPVAQITKGDIQKIVLSNKHFSIGDRIIEIPLVNGESQNPDYTVTFSQGTGDAGIPFLRIDILKAGTEPEPEDKVDVTFDLNYEGANPRTEIVKVTKGTAVSEPPAPVRTGYDFIGWYTDSVNQVEETKYDFTTPVTAPLILYAGWAEKQPAVGQDAYYYIRHPGVEDETTQNPQDFDFAGKGKVHNGLTGAPGAVVPIPDYQLAVGDILPEVTDNQAVTAGVTYRTFPDITYNGYTYVYVGRNSEAPRTYDIVWYRYTYSNGFNIGTDEYLSGTNCWHVDGYAVFNDKAAVEFKVQFPGEAGYSDVNADGTKGDTPYVAYVNKGAAFSTVEAPAMKDTEDYVFAGWYTDSTCTTKLEDTYAVQQSMTVYGKFVEKETPVEKYIITFVNYDNSVISTKEYVKGQQIEIPANPTRPAQGGYVYTFIGWDPQVSPIAQASVIYTARYSAMYIPPYIPPVDPGTDIEDPDVPLADLPGLNTKDHYAYIAGYPDGTVQPNGNITRAEVATIFFRLFTEEYRNTYWSVSAPFTDVEATDWFNTEVATVASAGVVNGYPDGTFLPNNNITRAEFATIAARFLSEEYAGPDLFTDISGHWAQEYINRAANAGWINGYPDGSFHPDAYITRAEAMTLVNNMLGRMPHEDHLLAGMKLWVDNPSTMWYYEAVQEATNGHDYDWAEDNSYEIWTSLTPDPDWEALEALWTSQNA